MSLAWPAPCLSSISMPCIISPTSYFIHSNYLYVLWIQQVPPFLRALACDVLSSWNALPLAVSIADLFKSYIHHIREAFPNYPSESQWALLFSARLHDMYHTCDLIFLCVFSKRARSEPSMYLTHHNCLLNICCINEQWLPYRIILSILPRVLP